MTNVRNAGAAALADRINAIYTEVARSDDSRIAAGLCDDMREALLTAIKIGYGLDERWAYAVCDEAADNGESIGYNVQYILRDACGDATYALEARNMDAAYHFDNTVCHVAAPITPSARWTVLHRETEVDGPHEERLTQSQMADLRTRYEAYLQVGRAAWQAGNPVREAVAGIQERQAEAADPIDRMYAEAFDTTRGAERFGDVPDLHTNPWDAKPSLIDDVAGDDLTAQVNREADELGYF